MTLALFDLDNTLIGGDSDHAWGEFLAQNNLVDAAAYKATNDKFYEDYLAGQLDMKAYLEFTLEPLKNNSLATLESWRERFIAEVIQPIMLPKAAELLAKHRSQGHKLVIITATNDFITAPIAKLLGVETLIAVEAELKDSAYTGKVVGTPSFREGKITRLNEWLAKNNEYTLEDSYFYSDSHNDLPLLEIVTHPIAVDPCPKLTEVANSKGWQIISLRD